MKTNQVIDYNMTPTQIVEMLVAEMTAAGFTPAPAQVEFVVGYPSVCIISQERIIGGHRKQYDYGCQASASAIRLEGRWEVMREGYQVQAVRTVKFSAVETHAECINVQVSPWFATAGECSAWCEANQVAHDAIMPVVNWREVQDWQNKTTSLTYRPEGAWEVIS